MDYLPLMIICLQIMQMLQKVSVVKAAFIHLQQ